jgi:hypothetical protein
VGVVSITNDHTVCFYRMERLSGLVGYTILGSLIPYMTIGHDSGMIQLAKVWIFHMTGKPHYIVSVKLLVVTCTLHVYLCMILLCYMFVGVWAYVAFCNRKLLVTFM